MGPRAASVSEVGRPKFEIAQELLKNLRGLGCTMFFTHSDRCYCDLSVKNVKEKRLILCKTFLCLIISN